MTIRKELLTLLDRVEAGMSGLEKRYPFSELNNHLTRLRLELNLEVNFEYFGTLRARAAAYAVRELQDDPKAGNFLMAADLVSFLTECYFKILDTPMDSHYEKDFKGARECLSKAEHIRVEKLSS